ncbi:hypothetical protein MKD38_13165 [Cupriavidus sp. WGlv3]|uniref:hypothetical protein n=1 Tax=Cupriavidus sp. WGlv3 TaxID=2919924 RepID=UPI002091870D|nr:hypothetical protein [Cupriavidus sp. WGlv3]MCO4862630.1 hypothetical protein [Cupriavidus sp. WGlv3]
MITFDRTEKGIRSSRLMAIAMVFALGLSGCGGYGDAKPTAVPEDSINYSFNQKGGTG